MKITVSTENIAAARPYPTQSPIALALQELGYADASCTHRFAYYAGNVCELPETVSNNEIHFDFIFRSGQIQGEVLKQIEAFEFEVN